MTCHNVTTCHRVTTCHNVTLCRNTMTCDDVIVHRTLISGGVTHRYVRRRHAAIYIATHILTP